MYPLRVLNIKPQTDEPMDFWKYHFTSWYPFAIKFNLSYIPLNVTDSEKKDKIETLVGRSFARNESDFVDSQYFGSAVKNSISGPTYWIEQCYLGTGFPTPKRDQHYDFMTIFDDVDYYTIAILVVSTLIVALLYGATSMRKISNSLWIIWCNFLKNSFAVEKTCKEKLVLTSFALFISLFYIVFLSFLNTNVISTSHLEKVDTLKDLLKYNISLMSWRQPCIAYLVQAEDEDARLIYTRIKESDANLQVGGLDKILSGDHRYAEAGDDQYYHLYFMTKCMYGEFHKSDFRKIYVSPHSFCAAPTNPYFRRDLPKTLLKRLNQYIHRSLDADITKQNVPRYFEQLTRQDTTRKITECYFLREKVLAEFSTLSLGYFKTTFLMFAVVVIIAVFVFLFELKF